MAYKVLKGFKEIGPKKEQNYFATGDMYEGENIKALEADGFIEEMLVKKAPVQEPDMEMETPKKKGK